MVEEIALTRSHVGIGQRLVDFERFCLHPFTIFPIKSLLRDFADVDFGIEVGGKGFSVVTSVAVYDVEIVDFVEVMLCCVSSKDRGDTRVETATEDGAKSGFLKAFAISPVCTMWKSSIPIPSWKNSTNKVFLGTKSTTAIWNSNSTSPLVSLPRETML